MRQRSLQAENARLGEAEPRTRQIAEILQAAALALTQTLDLDTVLETLLDHLAQLVPYDSACVMLLETESRMVMRTIRGYERWTDPGQVRGITFDPRRAATIHTLITSRQCLLIPDTAEYPGWETRPGTEYIRSWLGVPLLSGDTVLGAYSMDKAEPGFFTEEHSRLAEVLAAHAAVAIENSQLYDAVQRELAERQRAEEELRKHRDHLEVLVSERTSALTAANEQLQCEVVERKRAETEAHRAKEATETLRTAQLALTQSLDLDSIYEELLDYLGRLVPYDSATIFLLETDSRLAARAVRGYERWVDPDLARAVAFDLQAGSVMHTLVTTQRSVAIPDTRQYPGWVHVPSSAHIRSWLGVPMVVGGKVIGAYSVDSTQPSAFTQEHARLAESLAVQAAFATQNARLFEDAQRRANELETLRRSSLQLTSSLDLPSVLDSIAKSVLSLVGAENCHIYLYDEAKQTIAFSTALWKDGRTETPWDTPRADGVTATVAREGRPVVINDTVRHPLYASPEARKWGIQAIAGLPLKRAEHVLGVLNIVFLESHTFSEEELQVLSLLADQAAIAIENARLFAEVESQRQYSESLVQNSPVAIVTTDRDGNVLSWNPAAEKLFGYKQAEALWHNVDDLITTPELREEAVGFTRKTISGARVHAATRRRRRDGTLVDVEVLAVPMDMGKADAALIAIYHDITELQRARRDAEAATQAKSAFLATMSHEIRTPMNAVIGMTSLLLDTELTSEQQEFAETIRISGDALLAVINDVLDFSKIEAGRIELERQPFDLRECVEGAVGFLAPRATEKGLELVCLIDADVPLAIVGDETRLRQVLLNLLSNAVKFTEQGEVVVNVQCAEESEEQVTHSPVTTLHFSVRDTGIGIPSDRADRLFKSFSQVDSSTTRKYGGTGLGLAISDRLSTLMGGRMWVESPSPVLPQAGEQARGGPGSIFHFTIVAEKAEALPHAFMRGEQANLRGKRVLIVDDNAASRRILTLETEGWGMAARVTGSPQEALDWLRRGEAFDVALVDRQMPEMDGLMLAAEIRKLRDAAELPLVMVSSLARREAGAEGELFAAFLLKPIRASQLYDALVTILAVEGPGAPRDEQAARREFDAEMGVRWPLRILLAEDHVTNQKLALLMLGRLGYRADVAANGLEVLAALARQPYDVVLMDVQMPEMDGLEATRQIRRQWPKKQAPRIVAMTANVMKEDQEACFAAGMDDYLGKPIRLEALVSALSRCPSLAATAQSASASPAPVESPESQPETRSPETTLDPSALETLLALVGGEPTRLAELIDSFLQETPPLLVVLRRSLEEGDAAGLHRAAHTLKSSSRDFGATRLSEWARELEAMGKAGALAGAAGLVARVETEYSRVKAELDAVRTGKYPWRSAT